MKPSKLIGKTAIHKDLGLVTIISVPKGARTKVNIRCIQRGPGWDEATEQYKPVKNVIWHGDGNRTLHYDTCRRDEYGFEEEVHINTLELKT